MESIFKTLKGKRKHLNSQLPCPARTREVPSSAWRLCLQHWTAWPCSLQPPPVPARDLPPPAGLWAEPSPKDSIRRELIPAPSPASPCTGAAWLWGDSPAPTTLACSPLQAPQQAEGCLSLLLQQGEEVGGADTVQRACGPGVHSVWVTHCPGQGSQQGLNSSDKAAGAEVHGWGCSDRATQGWALEAPRWLHRARLWLDLQDLRPL